MSYPETTIVGDLKDLSQEQLAEVLTSLINKLHYKIVEISTPEYSYFEVRHK